MSSQLSRKNIEVYSLLFILLGAFGLALFIISPYLNALLGASVAAIIFEPLYRRMLKLSRNRDSLATLLTILIITALIIGPVIFIGQQIFQEGQNLYTQLDNQSSAGVIQEIEKIITDRFGAVVPIDRGAIDQFIKNALEFFSSQAATIFSSILYLIVKIAIGIFALYYFLKDGDEIRKYIVGVSPLGDEHTEKIIEKLRLTIQATIRGSLIVAFIQAVLLSIGLLFFGIPNMFLWGSIGFIAALVPALGTTLVTIPIILFLFLSGQTFQAVGFLIWGVGVVGLADNLIRPRLLGRHVGLHPFLVFLSVIG
ncbi:MAG: AI-2E family transporter, partial [Patescibacteria group bacterium]